ncbi:MAG: DoxX family protein [Candidatus Margulisiibacteriota bacterium]
MNILMLRIVVGVMMFAFHGLPKWVNLSSVINTFPDPIGLGPELGFLLVVFAEVFCSVLIITGTFFRLACIPLIFAMWVVTFIFHANDSISDIELPLFYLASYLFFFFHGPGQYSLRFKFDRVQNRILSWLLK